MSNTDKKDPTLQPEPPAEEILDEHHMNTV